MNVGRLEVPKKDMKEEILKVFEQEGRTPTLFEEYMIDDLVRIDKEMQDLRDDISMNGSTFEGEGNVSRKVNPSETLLDQKRKQFRAIAGELHLTTKSKPTANKADGTPDLRTKKTYSPLEEAIRNRG